MKMEEMKLSNKRYQKAILRAFLLTTDKIYTSLLMRLYGVCNRFKEVLQGYSRTLTAGVPRKSVKANAFPFYCDKRKMCIGWLARAK